MLVVVVVPLSGAFLFVLIYLAIFRIRRKISQMRTAEKQYEGMCRRKMQFSFAAVKGGPS